MAKPYLTDLQSNSSPVYGQYLARNQNPAAVKAFYGADLHTGKSRLVEPTVLQAAALARVNVSYVHAALQQEADREAIELGLQPLIPRKNGGGNGQSGCPSMEARPFSPMEHASIILDDYTLALVLRDAGLERVAMIAAAIKAREI